ncbi:MAG: hypothetical protein ACI837_001732 [Crocinitomicaceae bacterium]|jgi:hypothetical protein
MTVNLNFIRVLLTFLVLVTIMGCRQPDVDNYCQCIDHNGTVVLDTVYHMEDDQAYQLCEGKESDQTIWKCESSQE